VLETERNYWVATATAKNVPHARPVWGVFVEDVLFLSVGAAGFRRGDRERAVSVHVDSAVDVVILDGTAVRIDDGTRSQPASEAYETKYETSGDFLNFFVRPHVAWGWRDGDVATATKWTF
jgi:hypothetical protein